MALEINPTHAEYGANNRAITPVSFSIHRFTKDMEEIDEKMLAHLCTSSADFVKWLCKQDELEGALIIGDVLISDDLFSATQRLCFSSVEALVVSGASYTYPYFTCNANATLTSALDDRTTTISGDNIPTRAFSRAELLPGLYACGIRFLRFLEQLEHLGRVTSEATLLHMRPFAERALAALKAHGFA